MTTCGMGLGEVIIKMEIEKLDVVVRTCHPSRIAV
jgi:hypothetical protein